MTCELSAVTFARIAAFVAIGGCLLIISLAFFIGWGAAGEVDGNGFGLFCGAFALGCGDGVGRRICPLASKAKTKTARAGMKRRARAITLFSFQDKIGRAHV